MTTRDTSSSLSSSSIPDPALLRQQETANEVARSALVEEYIRTLPWSDDTPDLHKTLIAGNIRAFYAWLGRDQSNNELNQCRQILAADMTLDKNQPLPSPRHTLQGVALPLYGAIQELRERREHVSALTAANETLRQELAEAADNYRDAMAVMFEEKHRKEVAEQRLTALTAERDEAVKWIGRFAEELINAGGAIGDRTVALANLRAVIADVTRLREDQEWRNRWHTRLGRGEAETEGKLYERLDAAEQRLTALVGYTRHKDGCSRLMQFNDGSTMEVPESAGIPEYATCTCGLADLLREGAR